MKLDMMVIEYSTLISVSSIVLVSAGLNPVDASRQSKSGGGGDGISEFCPGEILSEAYLAYWVRWHCTCCYRMST